MLDEKSLAQAIDTPLFHLIGEAADELGVEAYVVGGYVRDLILNRPSYDIDVVSVGRGIDLARAFAKKWGRGARLSVFANFGTAQVKKGGQEIEFVGARKESYRKDSRKPIVEDGTLEEDQERRDFTINAMALCLNKERYGELVDPFYGIEDLEDCLLRTPLDPSITFSDDPLRMLRAIRFAAQLGFFLHEETFEAIEHNVERISIVSGERIMIELNKIMASPRPSIGLELLEQTGLMKVILPELLALKGAETKDGIGHKDNLTHTYRVVDNLAMKSNHLYLRWAALLHDIAKPITKRFDPKLGWTFHNHNIVGAKMVPRIFKRLKLPMDGNMKYVAKMVDLHMRPSTLVDEGVSDSAIRRLLFEAGDDIDDLMLLVEADITSKNPQRVKRYLDNYVIVRRKLKEIEEKDRIRNFQPPISGEEIMELFALPPSRIVGTLKESIKNAILDGVIPNEYEAAFQYLKDKASSMGLACKDTQK
ncbi:tRNA nucleotidyltransferase [Porphyromonas gingivicanis]|uniref:tRNA nucleotidyltransferase n=1 Tax=Porphyromonas gingivicanis TaxID=266762 RepID=A0A0A2G9Y8_9PORP|nr:HD domain-containing protein [Porphyromonas gingivicanis]KGN97269.1 tRNA nucleotidyltransferase [Porphyromonas gingivicanis]